MEGLVWVTWFTKSCLGFAFPWLSFTVEFTFVGGSWTWMEFRWMINTVFRSVVCVRCFL